MKKMNRTSFSLDVFGDRFRYADNETYPFSDNSKHLESLKVSLRNAMDSELTDCQRRVVDEFFFHNKSVTEIAAELGVNKSTVSRHLKRAKEKLGQALKYGLYPIWMP